MNIKPAAQYTSLHHCLPAQMCLCMTEYLSS